MTRTPIRFAWSRQSPLHRAVMRQANAALIRLPDSVKFGAIRRMKTKSLPYCLVSQLAVVQIGAPFDTLGSGRSRAAHLGLSAGQGGHLLVIEPYETSCDAFREWAVKNLECETKVVALAAWSSEGSTELYVDDRHPATNFSAKTVEYDQERLKDYRTVSVRQSTVDQIVEEQGFPMPDLVSITTNWAEREILQGMSGLIENGLQYISVALGENDEDYRSEMSSIGYEPMGFDDRGVTYQRRVDRSS